MAGYLLIIGLGLLLVPNQTLHVLGSNGHYGELFRRLTVMLISGLGPSIAGIIRARAHALYPATFAAALTVQYQEAAKDRMIAFSVAVLDPVREPLSAHLWQRATGTSRLLAPIPLAIATALYIVQSRRRDTDVDSVRQPINHAMPGIQR